MPVAQKLLCVRFSVLELLLMPESPRMGRRAGEGEAQSLWLRIMELRRGEREDQP